MKLTVNGQTSLSECIGTIRQTFKDNKFFQVTISTGKTRSLSQNALLHVWCGQISTEEQEYTPGNIKCLVKLNIFLPLLRAEDEEVNHACERVLDSLSYADKLEAMLIFPVTSIMKTKALSRGMDAMQAHYAGRVELLFPED